VIVGIKWLLGTFNPQLIQRLFRIFVQRANAYKADFHISWHVASFQVELVHWPKRLDIQ